MKGSAVTLQMPEDLMTSVLTQTPPLKTLVGCGIPSVGSAAGRGHSWQMDWPQLIGNPTRAPEWSEEEMRDMGRICKINRDYA